MLSEPWASVDVVAKHLTVAKDSIHRWIEDKSLRADKVGRRWKFSEVVAWPRTGGAADDGGKR